MFFRKAPHAPPRPGPLRHGFDRGTPGVRRAGLRASLTLATLLILSASPRAQDGESVLAPLPPSRPFDLDLAGTPKLPPIMVPPPFIAAPASQATLSAPAVPETPPAAASEETPASDAPATETAPTVPAIEGTSPFFGEPDEDEGVEWPKLAPGQKEPEPAFDPNEKPDQPGISTDPGTSIACLPDRLKGILAKIAEKYGAVKVTSTWRPPWRARRGSYHKGCQAMDFRVPGVRPRVVLEWARALPEVGGHHVYWNGLIHIDTGPRRPW